jgi:iron complex outermembrane receptor protein
MDHGRARRRRRSVCRAFVCTAPLLFAASLAQAQVIQVSNGDLAQLSLEELGDLEVTSVSKRPEPLDEAPTSIYVLTHDDIVRTGAARVPEVLRFAPNLQVAQTSASRYAISARGMNGAQQAQNFSNKLLVLIDGRSVYTPLFSGVYWDMQDVLLQDTDRIEVISGPGATLWGANAVNGVINITSRNSAETQGLLFEGGGGNQEWVGALRYGGRISDSLSFRVYGKIFSAEDTDTLAGAQGHDHWTRRQAGFRADWQPSAADAVTLQGDIYNGALAQPGAAAERIDGANILARWSHSFAGGSSLQLKAYYDHADRGFWVDTYDVDGQYSFSLGSRNEVVVGGGYRTYKYFIGFSPAIYFQPAGQTLHLANAFVQDRISLASNLKLTLGIKLEDNPYIKATLLPNARLSYAPTDRLTLWAAASRAIRSATPFDREVVEQPAGTPFLVGGPNFRSEKLIAYEAGARTLVSSRLSLSLAAYYNDYDDLRSIEATPAVVIPLYWGNELEGHTYGAELWGGLQLASWWRVSPGVTYHDQKFAFKPGGQPKLVGVSQVSNDPKWQAQLKSSMTGGRLTADAMLRYVAAMPDPRIPAYTELSARISYAITDKVQIALSGRNLLHRRHLEYVEGSAIPRSVTANLQWRF